MRVLIAFATSRGSTQGIAKRLAGLLNERGITAEARPVTDAVDVAKYDAIVLGSAIHGGKWLPEASRFVGRNAVPLKQRPVWLFSVSTIGDQESMFPLRVARKLRAMRGETREIAALRDAIRPKDHRNFAGSIARSDWPPVGRMVFRLMRGRYGDSRNWLAIDDWGTDIAAELARFPSVRPEDRRR